MPVSSNVFVMPIISSPHMYTLLNIALENILTCIDDVPLNSWMKCFKYFKTSLICTRVAPILQVIFILKWWVSYYHATGPPSPYLLANPSCRQSNDGLGQCTQIIVNEELLIYIILYHVIISKSFKIYMHFQDSNGFLMFLFVLKAKKSSFQPPRLKESAVLAQPGCSKSNSKKLITWKKKKQHIGMPFTFLKKHGVDSANWCFIDASFIMCLSCFVEAPWCWVVSISNTISWKVINVHLCPSVCQFAYRHEFGTVGRIR